MQKKTINFYSEDGLKIYDQALTDWVNRHDLSYVTAALFDVFGLRELEPGAFRTVLDFLAQDKVIELLSGWNDSQIAQELFRFAVSAKGLIDKNYFPSPGRLIETIDKKRKKFFLLLLIIGNADANYKRLRDNSYLLETWLIINAIEAIDLHGISAEKNVYELSRYFSFDNIKTKYQRMDICDRALSFLNEKCILSELDNEEFSAKITQSFINTFGVFEVSGKDNKSTCFERLYLKQFVSDVSLPSIDTKLIDLALNKKSLLSASLYSSDDVALPVDSSEDNFDSFTSVREDQRPEYQALSSKAVLFTRSEQVCYLPWSIFKPTPHEIKQLKNLLAEMPSSDLIDRQGFALTYLGMVLGRSPSRVEDILISTEVSAEWSLSPDDLMLRRLRPQNERGHVNTDGSATRLADRVSLPLVAVEEMQCIEIPLKYRGIISHLAKNNSNKHIGDIWRSRSCITLDEWFRKCITKVEDLSRLQPSMLQYVAEQTIFDQSKSNALTQILTYHPSKKLPSLVSYHTWSASDVSKLDCGFTIEGVSNKDLMFGSEQNLDDDVVKSLIQKAKSKLGAKYTSIPSYHNDFCLYCMTAIVAATGARTVRDPLEDINHFNFKEGIVYINDKSDGHRRDGRLCVLPHSALKFLTRYIKHLEKLASTLRANLPELSKCIEQVIEGSPHRRMGLFFLLNDDFSVSSVEAKHFSIEGPLKWEMPDNFFRHRFIKSMLSAGCEEEVIEGLTGHADLGISSYGVNSNRCIRNDLKKIMPLAEEAFSRLNFQSVESKVGSIVQEFWPSPINIKLPKGKFGIARRREIRKAAHIIAERKAEDVIQRFIEFNEAKKISDLPQEKFIDLQNKLLKGERGQPHHNAGLRFRYFSQRCIEEGPRASHYLRLSRRIDSYPLESSCFNSKCPGDVAIYERLKKNLDIALNDRDPNFVFASTRNLSYCLHMFMFLLIVETRLTATKLVTRALSLKNIRLIYLYNQYYIEFLDEENAESNGRPVQRHKVSFLCAKYLDRLLRSKSKIKVKNIPDCIYEVSGLPPLTQNKPDINIVVRTFFLKLARIVRNFNFYSLPGALAGSLDGDPYPTSLPWSEWIRVTNRKALVPRQDKKEENVNAKRIFKPQANKLFEEELISNAFELAEDFRRIFKDYTKKEVELTVNKLRDAHDRKNKEISSLASLFFMWVIHVCENGKSNPKTQKRKPYAQNSLKTLMTILYRPVINILGDKNSHELESEDFNELIAELIDSREGSEKSHWQFVLYIKLFFSWAEKNSAIPQIDWDLFSINKDEFRHVSSGLIFEDEYLQALNIVMNNSGELSLQTATILILSYRFGMRFSEAAWIRKADYFIEFDDPYMVVKDYSGRELKYPTSNRIVPLVFKITDQERNILRRVLFEYDSQESSKLNSPILFPTIKSAEIKAVLGSIATNIKRVLTQVTQRRYISEHHLRHTFANKLDLVLMHKSLGKNACFGAIDHDCVRKILIGDGGYRGLRDLRALSRAMGHGSPAQSRKSYCHITTLWTDQLIPNYRSQQIKPLASSVDVLKYLCDRKTKVVVTAPELTKNEQFKRSLEMLNRVSVGKDMYSTAHTFELDPDIVRDIENSLTLISKKRFPDSKSPAKELLSRIRSDAWREMISNASESDLSNLEDVAISSNRFPDLVSPRGHIFAQYREEMLSIVRLLRLLNIKSENLKIYSGKRFELGELSVLDIFKSAWTTDIRQDAFTYLDDDGDPKSPDRHLGFVLQRNNGSIRNSFALCVAIIVLLSLR